MLNSPAFMRYFGTVQRLQSKSISSPGPPKTSPGRAAVQDGELQRPRRHRFGLAQAFHERRDFLIRHGWQMAALKLLAFRQNVSQVTPPGSGRVLAGPPPFHLGVVEHTFDASARRFACFAFRLPYRRQHLLDVVGVDLPDALVPDRRTVSGEGLVPLIFVFCVAPFRLDRCDVLVGAFAERRLGFPQSLSYRVASLR